MKQGIRVGSAKDGVVTAYIPAPSIDTSPFGPVGRPEYLWVDDKGAIYAGEERDHTYREYVKRFTSCLKGKASNWLSGLAQRVTTLASFPASISTEKIGKQL